MTTPGGAHGAHHALTAIPVVSGEKYRTPQGFSAVRNGQKRRAAPEPDRAGRKPRWLRARLPSGSRYLRLKRLMREHRLPPYARNRIAPTSGSAGTPAPPP